MAEGEGAPKIQIVFDDVREFFMDYHFPDNRLLGDFYRYSNNQPNQSYQFYGDVNIYNIYPPAAAVEPQRPQFTEVWQSSQNQTTNLQCQNSNTVAGFGNFQNTNLTNHTGHSAQGFPSNCSNIGPQSNSASAAYLMSLAMANPTRLAAVSSQKKDKKKKKKAKQKVATRFQSQNTETTLSFGGNSQRTEFPNENKFLHFELESCSPYMVSKYKISNQDKISFEKTVRAMKGTFFDNFYTIDNWNVTPNEQMVLDTARYAIFVAHRLGSKGVAGLVEILECRMNGTVPALSIWRMTLLYLIHVIMAMEVVNCDFRSGPGRPFCSKFETMLTNREQDTFRRLVRETPSYELRQELKSLRFKWETYFTESGLKNIDRDKFWIKIKAAKVSLQPPRSPPRPLKRPPKTNYPRVSKSRFYAGSRNQLEQLTLEQLQSQSYVSPGNLSGVTVTHHIPGNGLPPNTNCSANATITPPRTSNANSTATSNSIISENVVVAVPYTEDLSLDTLHPIIDTFLNVDWLDNFRLSEEDKRNFTDRYSVKKPPGKNVVVLYNKKVEFCMTNFENSKRFAVSSNEKDKFIAAAKEAHLIARVFGKDEVSAVSEMLTTHMAVSPERIITKHDRLKSLLLVHIILYAEATQSSYKYKPKTSRSFCNAFSSEAFVSNFRKLVAFSSNKAIKQKLYWMRLQWNSCLLDQFLYKMDDGNFWAKNGVQLCEVPAHLTRKNTFIEESEEEVCIIGQIDKNSVREEVAVVELLSSDEEGEILSHDVAPVRVDNDPRRERSYQNYVSRESLQVSPRGLSGGAAYSPIVSSHTPTNTHQNYFSLFKTSRYNLWNAKFFMDDYCLSKLRQKYNFQTNCDAEDKSLKKMALELFSKTVYEILPSINEPKFLNLAKEAFFIETKFDAVNEVALFLVQIMEEGFEYCKSEETKLTSRLIGLLMIHTIIAIESVEPLIVPGVTDRWYVESFEDQHIYSSAKILIRKIKSQELRSKLKFLRLTWAARDESIIPERLKAKLNDNYNKEGSFFKDVMENYETNKAIFDKEKSSKRCNSKVSESNFEVSSPKKSRGTKIHSHVETLKNLGILGTSSGEKGKNSKENETNGKDSMAKKPNTDVTTLFAPDVIKQVPSTSQNSENSGSSERNGKRSHASGNSSGSLSITPAGLVGINGKAMRLESSQHGKEIENLRKMLQERNKKKKAKGAQEDQVHAPPTITEVQIDNFESGDFLDNLLTPTLTDFEIVYNEDGTAQVKFIHST